MSILQLWSERPKLPQKQMFGNQVQDEFISYVNGSFHFPLFLFCWIRFSSERPELVKISRPACPLYKEHSEVVSLKRWAKSRTGWQMNRANALSCEVHTLLNSHSTQQFCDKHKKSFLFPLLHLFLLHWQVPVNDSQPQFSPSTRTAPAVSVEEATHTYGITAFVLHPFSID